MKAVKILSVTAALLMCLSLAACYQQTDVPEGAEQKQNVLAADPNYAAPSQQKPEEEPEPETGKTSVPAPDKTEASEHKTTATVTGDADNRDKDDVYIGFTDREDSYGFDTGTIVPPPVVQTPAQPLTVKNVTLYTPDDPINTIDATYVPQELAPEKGEAVLEIMSQGQWIAYTEEPILWIEKHPMYPDYAVVIENEYERRIIHFCAELGGNGFIVMDTLPDGVSYADHIKASGWGQDFDYYTTTSETYNKMLNALIK